MSQKPRYPARIVTPSIQSSFISMFLSYVLTHLAQRLTVTPPLPFEVNLITNMAKLAMQAMSH